jgi:hypothetical protein
VLGRRGCVGFGYVAKGVKVFDIFSVENALRFASFPNGPFVVDREKRPLTIRREALIFEKVGASRP